MRTARRSSLALAALLLLVVPGPVGGATRVKAPTGQYKGSPGDIVLAVAKTYIDPAAFSFPCGAAEGRISINSIALKKTKKGYRFLLRTHGSVSFEDGRADENAAVLFQGRFSRTGNTVRGLFRVRSQQCRTGAITWTARR